MKHYLTGAFLTAALICSSYAQTELRSLDKPTGWISDPTIVLEENEGVLTAAGQVRLISSQTFDVDPSKTYTISVELRHVAGLPRTAYVGVFPLDEKGEFISPAQVNAKKGSDTVLTKPVKKGDKEIWIKENKLWNPVLQNIPSALAIAWDTKEDYSDLPNKNNSYNSIVSSETVNGEMKITLKSPMRKDLPAGTKVRYHFDGGYMYSAGSSVPGRSDFRQFTGSVTGMNQIGYSANVWPKGTKKFRLLILANWRGNNSTKSEIRNAKVTVK